MIHTSFIKSTAAVAFDVTNRPLAVFDDLPLGCIAFIVEDEQCWPMLRPGDVAVIDTHECEIETEGLYLYEYGRGTDYRNRRIQQITEGGRGRINPDEERWWVGPYYRPRGQANVIEAEMRGVVIMSDGPFAGDGGKAYLQERVIGRLAGVLAPHSADIPRRSKPRPLPSRASYDPAEWRIVPLPALLEAC